MPNITLTDVTNVLETVHGGAGRGTAIANGARAAYNAARPYVAKAGEALGQVGNYVGGALALKEGWDYLRGNNSSSPQQAPAPASRTEE